MRRETTIWMVLATGLLLPAAARAITAGEKCEADKLKVPANERTGVC